MMPVLLEEGSHPDLSGSREDPEETLEKEAKDVGVGVRKPV